MARKKQTAKEQAQGLGCLVLIGLAVVVYASSNRGGASSLTPSSASSNRTRTTSPAPSPTSSNYGQVIDVADEQVTMPSDVVFYRCQRLNCPEAGTIAEGQRILVTKMIGGETVDGVELWVVAEDSEGDEAYAPMVYVFPESPNETPRLVTATNDTPFVTPLASNTPRFTPTLSATSASPVGDVMEYNATLYTVSNAIVRGCPSTDCQNLGRVDVGQAVTVTGMVDGEIVEAGYAIWYRVEYDGAVGYIYQTLLTIDAPAPVATPAPSTNSSVSPTSLVCPKNCDEAVALGWTDVQAGQCDNLDRDNDGVACYGD